MDDPYSTDENRLPHDLLTANGYSTDEAAEIVLFARTNASPSPWIEVLARVATERARYQQALKLVFPASR